MDREHLIMFKNFGQVLANHVAHSLEKASDVYAS
jgi:hypothetical protein